MKKLLSILLAGALLCASVLTFASCSEAGEDLDKVYNNFLKQYQFDDSGKKELVVATSPDFAPMEFVDVAKKGQD